MDISLIGIQEKEEGSLWAGLLCKLHKGDGLRWAMGNGGHEKWNVGKSDQKNHEAQIEHGAIEEAALNQTRNWLLRRNEGQLKCNLWTLGNCNKGEFHVLRT